MKLPATYPTSSIWPQLVCGDFLSNQQPLESFSNDAGFKPAESLRNSVVAFLRFENTDCSSIAAQIL